MVYTTKFIKGISSGKEKKKTTFLLYILSLYVTKLILYQMKIREYFGELKTPMQIATEYIATAYFNGDIVEVEKEDIQNYVKQCGINPYELVFHVINEIEARTLSNIADFTKDYPILNVNWLKINIDNTKIESDLRILLSIEL